jgi:hypothetical protein
MYHITTTVPSFCVLLLGLPLVTCGGFGICESFSEAIWIGELRQEEAEIHHITPTMPLLCTLDYVTERGVMLWVVDSQHVILQPGCDAY